MSVFLKEKNYLLISILLIILDGIISYYLPSYFNKINYFYPMLTISFIPFVASTNDKVSTIFIIIIGIIYNLLFSNIFLFHPLVFILLLKIDYYILKLFKERFIIFLILSLLNIIIYDSLCFILILLTEYQTLNIDHLIYKIKYSLPNILSVFVYYFLCKKRGNKHNI